ncbi:hypothetical protein ACWDV4_11845 [Micromonospora sp. NPDC003197]
MEMSDDSAVVMGRQVLAEGRGLDVVLAAVRRESTPALTELAYPRSIFGSVVRAYPEGPAASAVRM